jgi:hypothetical protein
MEFQGIREGEFVPYRAVAAEALAQWRAATARMEAEIVDSPEWEAARTEVEAARAAYQAAVDAAHRGNLPEPPPFDDVSKPGGVL